ncbi:hypothetical protein ABMA32_10280 [Mesorhizobium sp. VNQ89]|uniref:hypothetical protein n=1 Tax=Mesorhizobium quangtriensis TaxID=3157709 RepID=UPI0032B78898
MAAEVAAEPSPRHAIPFDYLAVAEELHSGRIKVSGDAVAAEYRLSSEDVEAELKALLGELEAEQGVEDSQPAMDRSVEAEDVSIQMLSTDPAIIAIELGLDGPASPDLNRLRRMFALKNHPDRVPSHLRQQALRRMQVANGLIDEAKRKAVAKARR